MPANPAGAVTFSIARNEPTSWVLWNTKPNSLWRKRDNARSSSADASVPPSTRIVPESGVSSSPTMDSMVDLPEPDGDTKAMVSPESAENDVARMISTPSKDFVTPCTSRIAMLVDVSLLHGR